MAAHQAGAEAGAQLLGQQVEAVQGVLVLLVQRAQQLFLQRGRGGVG